MPHADSVAAPHASAWPTVRRRRVPRTTRWRLLRADRDRPQRQVSRVAMACRAARPTRRRRQDRGGAPKARVARISFCCERRVRAPPCVRRNERTRSSVRERRRLGGCQARYAASVSEPIRTSNRAPPHGGGVERRRSFLCERRRRRRIQARCASSMTGGRNSIARAARRRSDAPSQQAALRPGCGG